MDDTLDESKVIRWYVETLAFSYFEFLLGAFPSFCLPVPVCRFIMACLCDERTVSSSSFLCALIPHLLTGNHRPLASCTSGRAEHSRYHLTPPAFLQRCLSRPKCVMDTSSHDEHADSGYRFINYFPHLHTRWCRCYMGWEVACLFIEKVDEKCSRKWKKSKALQVPHWGIFIKAWGKTLKAQC